MSKILDKVVARVTAPDAKGSEAPIVTPQVSLSLENYVQSTKHITCDPWQRDLCRRLEEYFWLSQYELFAPFFTKINIGAGRPYQIAPSGLRIDQERIDQDAGKGVRVAIHAPPQFGKSIIISQCYPAWILGWHPLHRFRLATYNVFHSTRFSRVVRYLMQSPEHQAFFPDPTGQLPVRMKFIEWSTKARLAQPDGQASFTALGLQSGFVGTGFDTLLMDDPYKSAEEAMSEVIRDKTWRFWSDTASPRANEQSNAFIMFHRYHQDDMGGRAISDPNEDFDLLRYAAVCDGMYEDDESGRKFADPLGREQGDVLSERFGEIYYLRKKRNTSVWYSQFQGRPSAKTGKMFNVSLFQEIARAEVPNILHWVRPWDNAATEGAGAFTAGPLMGIDAAENIYVFDMVREQVNTAERQLLQEGTAESDGLMVQIHVPQDPGSAGKDVAFQFQQEMGKKGYLVTVTKVSGTKTVRAYPFSKAVNSQKAYLVLDADGTAPAWHKVFKNELQYFPSSTYKDQVDSSSDGYSHLIRLFYRGLVIKSASENNLLHRSIFNRRFGEKVPKHWEVAAAVRIAPDSSRPSAYVITARAADNAHIGEAVFILAAARLYTEDPIQVLTALREDLMVHCSEGLLHPHVIWLNRGANDVLQVTAQKMDMRLTEFRDESTAGIPETNWYLQKTGHLSPFYNRQGSTRCYAVVTDDQFRTKDVRDDKGMLSLRQDWDTWSYTEKGEPQPHAGITLDCLRMTLYKFALSATSLTDDEKRLARLSPELQPEAVKAKLGTPEFVEAHFAQLHALATLRMQEEEEKRLSLRNSAGKDYNIGPRAVEHRYRRLS